MCPSNFDFSAESGSEPGEFPLMGEEQLFAAFQKKGRLGAGDPALHRLAQAMVDLTPCLARRLCVEGLASLPEGEEKAAWKVRLQPFLNQGGSEGGRLPFPGSASI